MKFNSLPAKNRENLLKRLSGDDESVVVKTGSIVPAFIIAAAAIGWFGLLFILTNNYLWSGALTIIPGLISLVAAYFLVEHLYRIFLLFTSNTQKQLLVTPFYVIEINFNDIEYFNLEQLSAVNSSHRYQNRVYKDTQIKLDFENGSKIFKVKDLQTAEEAIDRINHLRKLFIEATARNDDGYLNAHNDFLEIESRNDKSSSQARRNLFSRAAYLLTAGILTSAIMFGAISLNRYFDDKKSWELAHARNRAAGFRAYLQNHQQGRWADEANQKLLSFYDVARQKYQSSLNKGYDQKAAEAILHILEYAKTTQNYRVKTVFEWRNEIPADIVETLKKDYEVKKILPLDDTFSDEKMKRREILLLTYIADAFRQIIPEDVLEISDDCSGECVTFPVKYTLDSDTIYYDTDQKDLPENERDYYPGIFISWNFGIKIPNQSENYEFSMISTPAEHIEYDFNPDSGAATNKDFGDVLNVNKGNIYNSMMSSAFDDFKENLIFQMGIGALPKSAAADVIKGEKVSPPIKAQPKRK